MLFWLKPWSQLHSAICDKRSWSLQWPSTQNRIIPQSLQNKCLTMISSLQTTDYNHAIKIWVHTVMHLSACHLSLQTAALGCMQRAVAPEFRNTLFLAVAWMRTKKPTPHTKYMSALHTLWWCTCVGAFIQHYARQHVATHCATLHCDKMFACIILL